MPQIGDITRSQSGHKTIWHACLDCGVERWVQLRNNTPRSSRCFDCGRNYPGRIPKYTRECVCSICGGTEYHLFKSGGRRCKECLKKRQRWHTYRIKQDEFESILTSQNNLCAICLQPFKNNLDTHIDHDHKCNHNDKGRMSCRNCIRGILCSRCNTHLCILEDEDWLEKALSYLGVDLFANGHDTRVQRNGG